MRIVGLLPATAAATAVALLLSACGGGDSLDGIMPEDLTQEELMEMVIQPQDLGPSYELSESHAGPDAYPPEEALDAYEVRYRLEPDAQGWPGVEVVISDVYLFPSSEQAAKTLSELKELQWEDPGISEFLRKVDVPDLGDETFGMLMRFPAGTWFIGQRDEPVEGLVAAVRRDAVVWTLTAAGEGASSDEVIDAGIDLAHKQRERVEAVLEEE